MNYPKVINQINKSSTSTLKLEVSPNLDAFDGHFDSFPIVPGVIQIQWALHFYKNSPLYQQTTLINSNKDDIYVSQMSALKFQQVIRPNSTITLTLSFDQAKQCLTFSITDGDIKYSSGKLLLNKR